MPTASFYKIGFENSKIFYEHCYGIKGQLKEWPLSVHEIALHFEVWLSNILSSLSLSLSLSEHNVRNTIANFCFEFGLEEGLVVCAVISTNRFLDILQ